MNRLSKTVFMESSEVTITIKNEENTLGPKKQVRNIVPPYEEDIRQDLDSTAAFFGGTVDRVILKCTVSKWSSYFCNSASC